MPKWTEDDAVEIAAASADAEKFEKKYPECVWNVGKMSPKETEVWLKKNAKADVGKDAKGAPPKNLWFVELEELEKEKLILYISPLTKKIVGSATEQLEAEPEEEELTEEDE